MTIESPIGSPTVRRFEEIEGLRGWLSWTVVGWHVVQYTGLSGHYRILGSTAGLAHLAVEIFIILSGFVVCHLRLTRVEAYGPYLLRRALRLFPLYLLMATIGIFATALGAQAVSEVPWANDPAFFYRDVLEQTYASQQAYPVPHLLLHLVLLQGLVPDSLLPYSSATLIGPAWSLSLEWQFYLIAPLLIGALRSRRFAALAVLILLALSAADRFGLFGTYRLMSNFPAAAPLFLTGIVSRLAFEPMRGVIGAPLAVALVGVAIGVMVPTYVSIGLWIGFFAFLVAHGTVRSGLEAVAGRVWSTLFGSAIARWFGARSYGVYVAHWPLLQLILFAARDAFSSNVLWAALMLAGLLIPATLVVAELLHRFVERPMIRFGAIIMRKADK